MTTPAVSFREILPGYIYSTWKRPGEDWKPVETYNDTASDSSEYRPSSVRSPKTATGWRAPRPYFHRFTSKVNPWHDFQATQNGWSNESYKEQGSTSVFSNLPDFPDGLSGELLEDAAVSSCYNQLSNEQAGVAENYATRQQTIDMFGDGARDIGSSVKAFRKKYPKDWSQVKKLTRVGRQVGHAIPDRWLALLYGWKPLLGDLYGTFNVMKDRDKDYTQFRRTVKARRQDATAFLIPEAGYSSYQLHPQIALKVSGEYSVFVRLDYCMVNPAAAELQRLGLVNPIALSWDLVPYSFVVDWFYPAGQYFSSWTADLGYQFLGGSVTHRRKCEVSVHSAVPSYWDFSQKGVTNYDVLLIEGGRFHSFALQRNIFTDPPVPRIPHFKNPLTLTHFSEAMSLLVGAFR